MTTDEPPFITKVNGTGTWRVEGRGGRSYMSRAQMGRRIEREVQMRSKGRVLCPIPTRYGLQCLQPVVTGEQVCRTHR